MFQHPEFHMTHFHIFYFFLCILMHVFCFVLDKAHQGTNGP